MAGLSSGVFLFKSVLLRKLFLLRIICVQMLWGYYFCFILLFVCFDLLICSFCFADWGWWPSFCLAFSSADLSRSLDFESARGQLFFRKLFLSRSSFLLVSLAFGLPPPAVAVVYSSLWRSSLLSWLLSLKCVIPVIRCTCRCGVMVCAYFCFRFFKLVFRMPAV